MKKKKKAEKEEYLIFCGTKDFKVELMEFCKKKMFDLSPLYFMAIPRNKKTLKHIQQMMDERRSDRL